MSKLLTTLEDEIRHALGIGQPGKTPFHNEILAIAAEMERKDATIKALADALEEAKQPHAADCPRAVTGVPVCSCGVTAALRLAGRLP